jgi:hypothetical protein
MPDSLQYIREYNSSFDKASVLDIEHVSKLFLKIDSIQKENPADLGYNKDLKNPIKDVMKLSGISRYISNFENIYLIQLTSFEPLKLYIGLTKSTHHSFKGFHAYLITENFCNFESSSNFLHEINLTGISKILKKPTRNKLNLQNVKEHKLKDFFNDFELNFLRKKDGFKNLQENLQSTERFLKPFFLNNKLDRKCFGLPHTGCHYDHQNSYKEEHRSSIFTSYYGLTISCKHYSNDTHIIELKSATFKDDITNVDDIIEQFNSLVLDNNIDSKMKKENNNTTIDFKASLTTENIVKFLNIVFSR